MSEADAPRKKGGRPRLYPGTEKRPTLTFRVRDRMHEQLSTAASESGRSLSEEIEQRLEKSFSINEIINATAKAAADNAVKNIHISHFGSRVVFEQSVLYAQILTGLISRLKSRSDISEDWFMPIEEARDYLKKEVMDRVDGMIEVLCFDIALMDLEGRKKYEEDAFKGERSIPREIAAQHMGLEVRKHAIRHKLLPHIMDNLEGSETDGA